MNRSTRTMIVVLVGLLAATAASLLVYRTVVSRPTREVEVAHLYTVVASHSLTLGARVTKDDVKLVAWPASSPVPGGMTTIEAALNRGVIAPIGENEPLTARNVASLEAGAGLPPTIPPGMRAISVRVNEVIGVAGNVVPGARVDVMVVLKQGNESVASVVASNVQVLTAGIRTDQDLAAPVRASTPSTVVTLMVTPGDAARIGLASTDGQIMLTLRNPLDTGDTTASASIRSSSLAGGAAPSTSAVRAPEEPKRPRRTVSAPVAAEPAAVTPPPPPPPPAYKVETIRAAKRTEETLR